jgi:hypothetical protein
LWLFGGKNGVFDRKNGVFIRKNIEGRNGVLIGKMGF